LHFFAAVELPVAWGHSSATGRNGLDSTTQIFRRSLFGQWALPLCFIGLSGTTLAFMWQAGDYALGKISIVLIFAGLAMTTWSIRHYSCIITNSYGVMVRRIGYTMFTPWDNILDIEYRNPPAIELKKSALTSTIPKPLRRCVIAWQDSIRYPGCQQALADGMLIPLAPFRHHIKSGAMRSAFRHHWPKVNTTTDDHQPHQAPVAARLQQAA
jgi:hypothetical protein